MMNGLLIGIIIFIFILLCLIFVRNKNSRVLDTSYKKIIGHNSDENSLKVVNASRKIKNPKPLEQYRLGDVLLNNLNQFILAEEAYSNALDNIFNNPLDPEDLFVIDRIEGDYYRTGQLVICNLSERLPYVRNYVTQHIINNDNKNDRKEVILSNKNKTERKNAVYHNKNKWQYDAQSVHDPGITNKMKENFDKIKQYNSDEYGSLTTQTANDAINELTTYVISKPDHNTALGVIDISKRGLTVTNVGTEHEVLVELWRRINSNSNKNNIDELKESLFTFMNICEEQGSLVCPGGRVAFLIQSLSHYDADKNLGNMETVQAIRNRIYGQSSKILNDHILSLDNEDKEKYDNNESNVTIKKMEDAAKTDIKKMIVGTKDINDNQCQNLIDECIAVV